MALASFYFTASAREERWLWFDYNSTNVNHSKATQVATLNEDIYSQLRQPIIDKLGINVNTFIGDLDIWNLKEVTVGLVYIVDCYYNIWNSGTSAGHDCKRHKIS